MNIIRDHAGMSDNVATENEVWTLWEQLEARSIIESSNIAGKKFYRYQGAERGGSGYGV